MMRAVGSRKSVRSSKSDFSGEEALSRDFNFVLFWIYVWIYQRIYVSVFALYSADFAEYWYFDRWEICAGSAWSEVKV